MSRQLLTYQEAADYLKMSIGWVKQAIRVGELPKAQFGRAVRIRQCDLDQYVEQKIAGTSSLVTVDLEKLVKLDSE